jgi:hypothetical protein
VRTLSTCPARITVLFGAWALAVFAVPDSAVTIKVKTAPHLLISRHALASAIEFFKPLIQAPRCELAYETRRV